MECPYCNKQYSSLSSLNHHKKNNKSCLILRQKNENRILELEEMLRQKDKQLQEKEEELMKKDTFIKEMAMKSVSTPKTNINVTNNNNTTTNTTNNNKYNFLQTFDLSPDFIKSQIDSYFTENHFLDGQKGVAIFTYDNLIKDDEGKSNYYCTDTARRKFILKNRNGIIQKDLKSETLTNLIANDIIAKSCMMYEEIRPELTLSNYKEKRYILNLADIKNIKNDNTTFVTTLAGLACNVITDENGDVTYEITSTSDDEAHDEELMRQLRLKFHLMSNRGDSS